MTGVIRVLLILHFVGLAMGLSVSFANLVMRGIINRAAPPERAILGRFPPAMSRVGHAGLTLLWVTGALLVFTKYGGFSRLPPQFFIKLSAVVLLTVTVLYIAGQERRFKNGDLTAIPRIERAGKLAGLLALIAIVFAVLTFG
jgi:hypothetical protein